MPSAKNSFSHYLPGSRKNSSVPPHAHEPSVPTIPESALINPRMKSVFHPGMPTPISPRQTVEGQKNLMEEIDRLWERRGTA